MKRFIKVFTLKTKRVECGKLSCNDNNLILYWLKIQRDLIGFFFNFNSKKVNCYIKKKQLTNKLNKTLEGLNNNDKHNTQCFTFCRFN